MVFLAFEKLFLRTILEREYMKTPRLETVLGFFWGILQIFVLNIIFQNILYNKELSKLAFYE